MVFGYGLAGIKFHDGLFVGDGIDLVARWNAHDDALTQASAILAHHLDVFVGYDKNAVEFEEVEDKQDDEKNKMKKLLNMSVNEIELSVRAANCLNNANITTVGQLAMKSEAEMLKYRNFGKKSLNEIKDKLTGLGLSLGMTFEPGLLDAPKEEPKATL